MSFEIQAWMAQTIDTAIDKRIHLLATAVNGKVAALSGSQATSSKLIVQNIQDVGRTIRERYTRTL